MCETTTFCLEKKIYSKQWLLATTPCWGSHSTENLEHFMRMHVIIALRKCKTSRFMKATIEVTRDMLQTNRNTILKYNAQNTYRICFVRFPVEHSIRQQTYFSAVTRYTVYVCLQFSLYWGQRNALSDKILVYIFFIGWNRAQFPKLCRSVLNLLSAIKSYIIILCPFCNKIIY